MPELQPVYNLPLPQSTVCNELAVNATRSYPDSNMRESSPLTAVIDDGRRSPEKGYASDIQRTRLHYPIPERLDGSSIRDEALRVHKLKMEAQLHADGAFSFPPKETCELLLEAYFTWFHPCFPILNRAAVHQAYVQGALSPLLLQAMLFIGVSLCTDAAFARTEYEMRYRAKFLFYSRARAIYDADWETNKILKLQSLFLLSFWRGGPSEERDTRFWLGAAISLAHKKGMHMMSKLSFQSAQEEKTWRRIWWALYIRDQQSAAALGLPPRIRDEDCDVAMLTPGDVQDDEAAGDERVFGSQSTVHIHYPVEMAKLARILRAIVYAQYLPMQSNADASSRATLHQQLEEWESNLPNELRLGNNSTPSATFLVGLLHMTYNNLYILLYRSLFLHPWDGKIDEGHIALEAATKSTRIIDDLLSQNLVQHGPTHLITHAFSTLCIQTIHCRRTTGTTRKLAEHRARLCLLGLQELQKSWDLENWVLDLFFRCLDDSTARTLRLTDAPVVQMQGDPGERSHATEHIPEVDIPKTPATGRDALGPTEITAANEWYSLFNFTDDYTDVVGTSPSQADSLNLQNLEFLYRFL
ncbi:hypothetical protein CNMCM5793_000712 [Aspergillus hiratsukae]|uniref:Xylanolytic transcriptional activator regulatory domain-containing protein n=1 Tax=Aspergillus hiratsukae TaxID=1194566 RepID=A0A8H6P1Z6_9EURO|nr:hypothetical protein CNMCM5793_000712 [Aspergillus hiratsukae]